MKHRHFLAAGAPALLLIATSCGGAASSESELTWEDSPMSEVYASLFGDDDRTQEDYERESVDQERRLEELVASCMADEGFDYTPRPVDNGSFAVVDDDWGSEEWTQQYGYGITTQYGMEIPEEEAEQWSDPNEAYLEAMSDSERIAYEEAMWGPPMEIDEADWDEEGDMSSDYDWESAGCYGAAQHEVYESGFEEDQAMWEDPALEEFFEAYDRAYQEAERDPRIVELNGEWSQCMEDEGFSGLTDTSSAWDLIQDESDRIYTEAEELIDWESIDWENLPDGTDPHQETMEELGLAELREREIKVAVADYSCQQELNLESEQLKVIFEYEETFVEDHQSEIEQLVATFGQDA